MADINPYLKLNATAIVAAHYNVWTLNEDLEKQNANQRFGRITIFYGGPEKVIRK
jgi:hypothetical protein